MEPRPSVFKRGFAMLWERPAAYVLVTILPYVVAIGLPILVGRLWFHFNPPAFEHQDPAVLWNSMGWGARLLIILAMIASATVPAYVAARGVGRLALEQQKDAEVSLGAVMLDMLRFVPTAILYFLVLGIATFLGGLFLVIPGLLIAAACALIIPSGIDGQLGPLAAMRRGLSLVGRVFGRVLGVYACYVAFVLAGRVGMLMLLTVAGIAAEDSVTLSPATFLIPLGLWALMNLLATAPVNIIVTLLYCEASEMVAPPPLASAAHGVGNGMV